MPDFDSTEFKTSRPRLHALIILLGWPITTFIMAGAVVNSIITGKPITEITKQIKANIQRYIDS